ncbi:MAG: hypothetical protein LBD11_04570 [Candidatus Peribacteria bacterium]|jgi:hypothetical protein|nr:hypothetical protein [Candidatus Peribacteria bacterium]
MDKLAGPRDPKIQSCFELAPSRVLQKSESAMRHTLDITFPTEEETYVFGTDLEERRNEKYQASDGKIYHVGVKKNKKGTEFFYATDEANGDSGCYLLSTGQKVAKDYFAQKEKFLTAKEIRDESQSAKQIPRQW